MNAATVLVLGGCGSEGVSAVDVNLQAGPEGKGIANVRNRVPLGI
jgi:hypothetical protein